MKHKCKFGYSRKFAEKLAAMKQRCLSKQMMNEKEKIIMACAESCGYLESLLGSLDDVSFGERKNDVKGLIFVLKKVSENMEYSLNMLDGETYSRSDEESTREAGVSLAMPSTILNRLREKLRKKKKTW
ncbi:MAG: hypothetical protein JRE23_16465 [Deltaproteobacteria bacterium]|nr:hypothetical protein [Deltaproteobacteria bacterium]